MRSAHKPATKTVTIVTFGLFMLFGLLLLSFVTQRPQIDPPKAVSGVLDATGWDFARQGNVKLEGKWEFYHSQLLSPDDFTQRNGDVKPSLTGYMPVPAQWENYPIPNSSPFGYGTFRLRVKMQKQQGTIFGIKQAIMRTAHRVFVNGREIGSQGVPGRTKEETIPGNLPYTRFFAIQGDQAEIIVQIANYEYSSGGFNQPLVFGVQKKIISEWGKSVTSELLIAIGFLLAGAYFLALYLMRRKERAWLYFGLFGIFGCIYMLTQGEKLINVLIPDIPYEWFTKLQCMSGLCAQHFILVYAQASFPGICRKGLVRAILLFNLVMMGITLFTPVVIFSQLQNLFFATGISCILCMLYVMIVGAFRGLEGAIYMAIGAFSLLAIDFTNLLYILGYSIPVGVNPVLLLLLICSQVLLLSKRFTNTYVKVEKLSEQLMAMDKLKDEFLANTSHELKTPLHGIVNIAQSLMEGAAGKMNGKQEENMAIIVSAGRRMANLVNDILDLAKLKNDEIVLKRKQVELQPVVQVIFEMFRHLIGPKPLRFVSMLPESPLLVFADEDRLTQILYNLLGNALRFTAEGEIVISAVQKNGWLEISVRDTGIGIPEENWQLIFNSFEQTGSSVAREYGGTGLGLSITRRLVELHGGSIWVHSEVGVGSVFTFTLPVTAGRKEVREEQRNKWSGRETALIPAPLPAATQMHSDGFTVLVVDDDAANLQVLRNILSMERYNVIAVSNGEEALRQLEERGTIDLVITDLMMPGLSGIELCKRIREHYSLSELPVVMLTARNWQDDILAGFAAGVNDYLGKPVDAGEMKARIRTLVELKKSVQERIGSEIAFLQAQIKPHFLFNTLNTILAVSEKSLPEAQDLLAELGHYLRGSFDFENRQQRIPIRKELELVMSYLTIEKARFGERLKIIYEIDPTLNTLIPPLVIQPLVENAVRHGVTKKTEGGTVKVSVQSTAEHVVISVQDDGVGMDLKNRHAQPVERGAKAGVGLYNVERRLKAMYGCGLEINSTSGKGTSVTMRLRKEGLDAASNAGG
ncbi:UNVERIFIED_CONTAM: two-component system sensor histidine kinase ChiS [Brevibacillus sp. OAP136]